jgi:hypothetical protein
MSSGYEWASSTESFLACTSSRRGLPILDIYQQKCHMQFPECLSYTKTSNQNPIYDMDMQVTANPSMLHIASKRKDRDMENDISIFKRQRVQW